MSTITTKRKINDDDIVKVIKINDDLRVIHNSFNNRICKIRKINDDHCVNTITGELIEFKRSQDRSERICDFKRSLSKLRDLIKTNVTEPNKCFFITLSYKENISDRDVLRKDFDNFIKKFRKRFGKCEYINTIEYQNRGALHCHLIVIFDKVTTIPITDIDIIKCWNLGSADIGPVTSADAAARYLTNFLFEYDEQNKDLDYRYKSKKQRKSERVSLYKSNSRLYNCSQGIKRPQKIVVPYKEFKEMFDSIECTNALSIWNDDNNIVTVENYKIHKEESDDSN